LRFRLSAGLRSPQRIATPSTLQLRLPIRPSDGLSCRLDTQPDTWCRRQEASIRRAIVDIDDRIPKDEPVRQGGARG
jgi:hypothetical protein